MQTLEQVRPSRRCLRLTHADVRAHAIVYDDTPADLSRSAAFGPAIGAALLAVAWGACLAPVFFGIIAAVS